MKLQLDELATILEEEIALGERLREVLIMHRDALSTLDVTALVASVELREAGVCRLAALESRRRLILEAAGDVSSAATLKEIINACPEEGIAKDRLKCLRKRAREVFVLLRTDERDLSGLLAEFRVHFNEALSVLTMSSISVYSESGAAVAERAGATVMCRKA
jgi:hypothetical protein